ncbi:MAG: bifunctional nuclease family protein [Balneolaceae bacterium]|nr:bifunctional nuclease family protein [Balneolaceae bacterium]
MDILGLSTSPSSGGAYALILTEVNGMRRLPIIIGSFEAQAIALELENIKPPRPMTHDLLKNMIQGFEAKVKHVVVSDLSEGTFYSKIIVERGDELFEVDARPSDAIALSVRFGCEIYVSERILKEAGISADQEAEDKTPKSEAKKDMESINDNISKLDQLKIDLHTAIETENYEKAAKIRDQISKMKG